MFKTIKDNIKHAFQSRGFILAVVFLVMAGILIQRLFYLQIIKGEDYLSNFTMSILKERVLKSTRGIIYDNEGKPLAYNKLAYSVTFADNGTYETTRQRNLEMNGNLYNIMKVIEENGSEISVDFGISIDSAGNYSFTKEGWSLLRFKGDIYGRPDTDDLLAEERDATAEEMMMELSGPKKYGIIDETYTAEELQAVGLPTTLTNEEILKLTTLRSAIAQNSYQKFVTTTIARGVNEETVAVLMENTDNYPGVDIIEESVRIYEDSLYFAPLIGYTGNISQEELEKLNDAGGQYISSDIVGKAGLEQTFESTLQGIKGSDTVYVDNLGKILKKDSEVAPQAGNDLYLTIDRDLQIATYKILEQYIAGILLANIVDAEEFDREYAGSSDNIRVPIFDVYFALFENNVLDAKHLAADDASEIEKRVYSSFLEKQKQVFQSLRSELTQPNPKPYKELEKEMQAYMSYIVNDMLMAGTGVLDEEAIDKSDETYKAWKTEESISLKEFLTYCISKDWIDITKMDVKSEYLDSNEIYNALADYITAYLANDDAFSRKVYKYMIKNRQISGTDMCLLLFDQGVIKEDPVSYEKLQNGTLSAYDFMLSKIYSLEITPAQLALEPCSGSAVITDPYTGDVLACVTYPGYDSNRLANNDYEYFEKLRVDGSSPFYNKATQELTAPGSTFKLVSATAGVMEGVISPYDAIQCKGKFEEVDPPINCWIYSESLKGGAHGPLTLETAIGESCNYFFNTVGMMLEEDSNGEHIDAIGVEKLTKYANMYGFDSTTGIEIGEAKPNISKKDAPRTAMGQADNTFTTTQLARYVSTLANSGTTYDLTLVDKITDSTGDILEEKEPVVHSRVELPTDLWNTIHSGMNRVVKENSAFEDMKNFEMAGKTGTAQQSKTSANHALFIGYAPYQNPEIALAVRITNGYTSRNAAAVAKDIVNYKFNLKEKGDLVTGHASSVTAGSTRTD